MSEAEALDLALPTDRRTLPAAIAERLRERIIEGDLAPGVRLNERQLCERMDVSRTPLREALRLLAHEGLVTVVPNRGAFVAQMSPEAVRQSFEIMGALEALAAERACRHITDAEVAEIAALTFEMQACHARGDLPEYYRLNRAVHDAITAASRNPMLDELMHKLNLRIQNLRFRSNLDVGKWNAAVREHLRMVELLRKRDADGLARLMREHLARKAEAVLAMVS
jgi:DNA-binding GntR family transcriptional regulator